MGFASGLPRALPVVAIQAWMAVEGVDLRTIGIFGIVALPYTLKFFWSPLMDRFIPPVMGRRRGWILITQLLLVGSITSIAFSEPAVSPLLVGVLALILSFSPRRRISLLTLIALISSIRKNGAQGQP